MTGIGAAFVILSSVIAVALWVDHCTRSRRRPHTAAGVVIYDSDLVLTVTRKDDATQVGLPMGKFEPGVDADLLDTAVREVREETGVVLDRELLRFVMCADGDTGNDTGSCMTTTYFCTAEAIVRLVEKAPGETGIVAWRDRAALLHGPFSRYNFLLLRTLWEKGLTPAYRVPAA